VKVKTKAERDAQWERVGWRYAARHGLLIDEAVKEVFQKALMIWICRFVHLAIEGLIGGEEKSVHHQLLWRYRWENESLPHESHGGLADRDGKEKA